MAAIFSRSEWEKLYPASEYNQKTDRVKRHVVHFLLGQSQKDEMVIGYIGKNPNCLAAHDDAVFSLTPLMIAVMQKRDAVVDKLLTSASVIKNINDTDRFGWTALHHAAFSTRAIFAKLVAAGADQNRRTPMGGSIQDLQALVSLNAKAYSKERVEGFPDSVKYRDLPYFPNPKDLWQLDISTEREEVLIGDWSQNPPLLKVTPFKAGGYQLEAGEFIPKGKVIGEYGGVFHKQEKLCRNFTELFTENEAYLFYQVDAIKMGNALRFVNSDFPNVITFEHTENGVEKVFYCAGQDIPKGEPLAIDYGPRPMTVSYGPQLLLRREEMRAFFRKMRLPAILQEIDRLKDGRSAAIERIRLASCLLFPFSNPLALIDLHFSNIVPCNEWINHFNSDHHVVQTWTDHHNDSASYLGMILMRLKEIKPHPLLSQWVLEHLESTTLMNLMKAIEKIDEELQKGNTNFKAPIREWLKSYDWTQDETNLFSYKSRKQHVDFNFTLMSQQSGKTKVALIQSYIEKYSKNEKFKGSETEQMFLELLHSYK